MKKELLLTFTSLLLLSIVQHAEAQVFNRLKNKEE